jgi:arylamine N-acetyltransferase
MAPLTQTLLSHHNYSLSGSRDQDLQNLFLAFSRIPYENLTKIIRTSDSSGSRIQETPADLIDSHVKYGTGGTCFALTNTLIHLLRELSFEAYAILADRRYGVDTHCAVIAKLGSSEWNLIDPGYMIHTPCRVPELGKELGTELGTELGKELGTELGTALETNPSPESGTVRYTLPLGTIELRAEDRPNRVALFTSQIDQAGTLTTRYRLTYKTIPVDHADFSKAWERSFDWEMMRIPIVSAIVNDSHLCIQNNSLLIRSQTSSTRITLQNEELAREIANRLNFSLDVVRRVFAIL